jgi:hypothetical protein
VEIVFPVILILALLTLPAEQMAPVEHVLLIVSASQASHVYNPVFAAIVILTMIALPGHVGEAILVDFVEVVIAIGA